MRRLPAPSRRAVVEGLTSELAAGGIPGARHEAERLMSHCLGVSRTDLLLQAELSITPEDAGVLAEASRRRLSGVPLQHIEGTVVFRDLVLLCDERALVPRPETEQLVQRIVDWAGSHGSRHGVKRVARRATNAPPRLGSALDIGTGSGAIVLSLLHEGVVNRAVAVDVSGAALEQAKENARRAGLEERVDFRESGGSPWDVVDPGEVFDLVVSNPPYVADHEFDSLPTEVRDHDPREALAGGIDGLDLAREILAGAPSRLRRGGALFLEIGAEQGDRVRRLLELDAAWTAVHVERDLSGRDRFVIAHA